MLPFFHSLKLGVSQVNGCAYCVDMREKGLIASGEIASFCAESRRATALARTAVSDG
jgi:AhpD family alkylhydroperoxidase